MLVDLGMVGLAALAGMCGALVGGNGVFVMYGIAGLAYTMLQACGVVLPVFEDGVLNCFLLPCVIFNGACAAAGYAGYRGRMSGQDINHSLASLGSTTVLLVAAVGAVFGYVVVTLLNAIGFPADTGAVTVVAGGIVVRALFGRSKSGGMGAALNERETRSVGQILRDLGGAGVSFWTFQAVEGLVCAGAGTACAYATGNTMLGFYVTAALILLLMMNMGFPACHHTVLVAAYALAETGNCALAVAFGLIAHLLGLVVQACINTGRATHLDPPAVAIASLSLVLFTLF